ncbi:hypothetical protein I302_105335 [Kwoniella bestiolae CBS 10118]|uniref:Uncharacterized protein n=1 Tax=Kwoniella bestiolae CBS 10118 TaxID=1296100 RepID=A0A1B9FSV1_9TREE|nr:hypothetical protein I302_08621 [Kwoniella bestiolae CBS 10118]OCF21842.1 hypothetical protein I302_08621 [Kwoniella bestiolae CBS 10118]
MGSHISMSSRRGAEIINDHGVYSRSYLVPDQPESMEIIQNKILPKFKWILAAEQVTPLDPAIKDESSDTEEDGQPHGTDGYMQVEFTKKGLWSSRQEDWLSEALHHYGLVGFAGRPRKLKDQGQAQK